MTLEKLAEDALALRSAALAEALQTIKRTIPKIGLATLPILIVYPFLQKYFSKGVLTGSIKG